jgi:hypothetical protein
LAHCIARQVCSLSLGEADQSRLESQDTEESTLSPMKSQIVQPRTPPSLCLLALTHPLQVSRRIWPKATRDRRIRKDSGDLQLQKHNRLSQTSHRRHCRRSTSRIRREKIHQRRPCRCPGHSRRPGTSDPPDSLPISSHPHPRSTISASARSSPPPSSSACTSASSATQQPGSSRRV